MSDRTVACNACELIQDYQESLLWRGDLWTETMIWMNQTFKYLRGEWITRAKAWRQNESGLIVRRPRVLGWGRSRERAGSAWRGSSVVPWGPCPRFSSASDHSIWVSLRSSSCSPRLSRSGIPQNSIWPLFFLLYTLPRLSPTVWWKLENHYFQLSNMFTLTLTGGHRRLSVSTGRVAWVVYLSNL